MRPLTMWIAASAMMATAATAMAQAPPPPGPPPPPHERLAAALDLTPEQKTAWDAARRQADGNMRGLEEQARSLQGEITGLLEQPNPDPTVLGQRMIALHDARGRLRRSREDLDGKLVAMLTPEQKLKYDGTGGGMMVNPMPGTPSHWLAYVGVDDIHASTKKARDLGAAVLVDVTEVGQYGWMSVIQDPTGAALALWKPKSQ